MDSTIVRSEHNLSQRGWYNFAHRDVWGPRQKSMGNAWSPTNPNGTVLLRLAENSLMHDEVAEYIHTQIKVLPPNHLTYSTGPRGSHRLRHAAASFLNRDLFPRENVSADNIFITPGLASAIDALTFSICDEGDGILVPQPFYNGFLVDAVYRSNARLIGVPYAGVEGYQSLDDLFAPLVNRRAVETALNKARSEGIRARALLVCNPHNPLGRCYPPETLKEFANICGENELHLISDEIYAKSIFPNPALPNPTPFVSALALDLRDTIDPKQVHLLYGASKDFCANGLRLGFVCTQNEGVIGAISSISVFSWSPHVLQDVWAGMLEDQTWMDSFMTKKAKLMAENYSIATSFFYDQGIPYYEMNAGLFIWVDLRHLLLPVQHHETEYNTLSVHAPDAEVYKQREQKIADICMAHGVMIAPGHVYAPEEYGWFRITFSLGREALIEGLARLRRALDVARLGESG